MKRGILFLLILASLVASAFDTTAWLTRRSMLEQEATRLAEAYTNFSARVENPSEHAVVPLETFPGGAIKLKIEARYAQFFTVEGFVWGKDVVIIKYDEDGEENARLEADSCLVDRATKSGWASGSACLIHGETRFDGEDLYFSSPESYTISFTSSKIHSTDLKFGGAL